MKLYKLTDKRGNTKNNTHWEVGVTVKAADGEPKLCSRTVLHAYTSPLLAALMNPAHANFDSPMCFEVEGDVLVTDGTKVGCKTLTVVGTFKLPKLTIVQRVAFGIYATLSVYKDASFGHWAKLWLSGLDRTDATADAAAYTAATYTYASADAAIYAAYAASNAADAAAATAAASAASAAHAAASNAAHAAASNAADAAAASAAALDFESLAKKALRIK